MFLKKLFCLEQENKHEKEVTVFAPLDGEVMGLDLIPDPAFGLIGKGVAINPEKGELFAPFDGEVAMIFPTAHAIGLKANNGLELLIHIGINSVGMRGAGFETHVVPGEKVKLGQLLITFSLAMLKEKATSTITPIVVTDPAGLEVEIMDIVKAEAGKTALMKTKL